MRIDKTVWLYPAPPGTPLTPVTPPPSVGGPEAMNGDCHPAVDELPRRSFREHLRLHMLRRDRAGCMAVINGMDMGFYIRRVRCFAMYGAHAPRLELHPLVLAADGGVTLSEQPSDALPFRNAAVLLTAATDGETPPGKYRTDLEVEGETGVFYMPVVIDVADADTAPAATRPLDVPAADPLDILFSAAGEGPFPRYTGGGYAGLMYDLAYHDRMLYERARQTDPLLTDTLVGCLRAVRTHTDDDAALVARVRRALVYRLDSRFDEGNREPSMPKGGVTV